MKGQMTNIFSSITFLLLALEATFGLTSFADDNGQDSSNAHSLRHSEYDDPFEQSHNPTFSGDPNPNHHPTPAPVPFKHCTISDGHSLRERKGFCHKRQTCWEIGGTPSHSSFDNCNDSEEVCCLIFATCNASTDSITVKREFVYISHSTDEEGCLTTYRFPRQSNVCQLRLEFKRFNLSPPNRTSGDCVDDKMTIGNADNLRDNLVLCGKANETDHLYLHYGESNEIAINLDVAQQRNFGEVEILVQQIQCNDQDLAPEGCTQYFTQQRGDVRSFNFDRVTGQQLNNQIYSICIKGSEGSSSVVWSPCTVPEDFEIVNAGNPMDGSCSTDSITIPGTAYPKYCLPGSLSSVETKAKPYLLYVHLDAQEQIPIPPAPPAGMCPPPNWVKDANGQCVLSPNAPVADLHNRGFCLKYQRT